jgi:hypothetical protein
MDIPKRIDEIIAQRREKLPFIQQMQERLLSVEKAVQNLDIVCQEAASDKVGQYSNLFKQHPETMEKLRLINTKKFHEKYKKIQEGLQQLEIRFSRKQVHISFVGRAGQGKSLLMQKISGLSNDVIPSSDGADCTGAKSIITNKAENNLLAEICFYSEQEYVDIVNKYLKEIFDDNSHEVHSVDGILALKGKELESKVDNGSASKQSLYAQLEKYIEHSKDVIPFLGQTKSIPVGEIESYIAQYSADDHSKKYYKYLGIKVANILCHFPFEQCGKIVLVDTIGLGATALDLREKMLETVSNDSDVILMMTRPDAKRPRVEQDDIDIMQSITDKVGAEYTRQMLFWVLNRVSSGNGENTEGISNILDQLNRRAYPLAGILNIDCKDSREVEQKLLIPVLEKLSNNLINIDNILIQQVQKRLDALHRIYLEIAEKVNNAFSASIDEDLRREFSVKIQHTFKNMTNTVRDLYLCGHYGQMRGKDCEQLKTVMEEKLYNILQHIPDKKMVLSLLNDGSINQHNAYEKMTDQMRIRIIDDFLEINVTLQEIVRKMKNDVIDCLADKNHGRLAYLISRESKDADIWIQELIRHLESSGRYSSLVEALQKLLNFNLRMESFLIYRVRAHLDKIDISLQTQTPEIRGGLDEKEKLADDILFWLEDGLETVYKEIRVEMEPLYSYPNNALWAVVKDFYDRIVYSGGQEGKEKMETIWRYLYEDAIPYIWREDYNAYQQRKGMVLEWNTLIEDIRKYNDKETFSFH